MKYQIILLAAFVSQALLSFSQEILSHNTDQLINGTITLTCLASIDGDQQPDVTMPTSLWRSYRPSEFGYSGAFEVIGVQLAPFYISYIDESPEIPLEIRIHETTGDFPGGELSQIHTETVMIGADNVGSFLDVTFLSPIQVDANDEVIIEVFIDATPDYIIGSLMDNGLPQTAPSYVSSATCGFNGPTDFAALGFPNSNVQLNLIGDIDSSVELNSSFSNQLIAYPNPTKSDVCFRFDQPLSDLNVQVFDSHGRLVQQRFMDSSEKVKIESRYFDNGMYLVHFKSNEINQRSRFFKE